MVGRKFEMSTRSGSKARAGCFAVVWLFLAVPWVYLRFVIVVFSDHTHLLFLTKNLEPDLDPNCSSLYPVSAYYIRNLRWPVMGCWLDKKNQHAKR